MSRKEVRSPVAIMFGVACTIGTLIVLFGHVRTLEDLTISHLYIFLALIVAYGAGHFMWEAFNEEPRSIFSGLSFTVLFLLATVICVGFSAGRSGDIIEQHERDAKHFERLRIDAQKAVQDARRKHIEAQKRATEARTKRDEATDRLSTQCESGAGTKCKGSKESLAVLEGSLTSADKAVIDALAEVYQFEQAFAAMGPPTVSNGELRHIATLISLLFGTPEDHAFALLKHSLPYVLAFLTEFGAIVFIKYGTTPIPARPLPPPAPEVKPLPAVTLKEIADELGIEDRLARKYLRAAREPRPELGWCWDATEAQRIRSVLSAQNSPQAALH